MNEYDAIPGVYLPGKLVGAAASGALRESADKSDAPAGGLVEDDGE